MTVLILDDGLAKDTHPRYGVGVLPAGRNRSEDLYDDLVANGVETLIYDGRSADGMTELLDPEEAAKELLRRVRERFSTVPLSIRRVIVWSVRVGNKEIDHFCSKYSVAEGDMADRGKVGYKVIAKKIMENNSAANLSESREVDVVLDLIWFGDPEYGEELLDVLI